MHSQEYIFDLYFIDKEIKTKRCEVTWPGTLAGQVASWHLKSNFPDSKFGAPSAGRAKFI